LSTSDSRVKYNFNLSLVRGDDTDSNFPVFTTTCGMTDEIAIALAKAFRDLPWPAGTSVQGYVTRHEVDEIQSEGDLDTGVFV
jgi:hypothetical protein